MRQMVVAALACWAASAPVPAEMAVMSGGSASWEPDLGRLEVSLSAAGNGEFSSDRRERFYVSVSLTPLLGSGPLSAIPWNPAQWTWLDASWSHCEAEANRLEIEFDRLELTWSLYMHLFRLIPQIGAGATAVDVDISGPAAGTGTEGDDMLWGLHGTVGVALRGPWSLGVQLGTRYLRLRKAHRIGGVRVGLNGWDWRLGIAWMPENESWILNW